MKDENIVYLGPEMKGKSLQEIAEHLKGRELFPESNKRMKELIANVKWPKELLIEKK
jgi:hypothetical protein